MKVAVWDVGEWIDSKYDDTSIKRIVFKGLNDKKSYYLNLNTKFPDAIAKWEPALQKGNVLDVNLQSNGKNINYFSSYILIKKV